MSEHCEHAGERGRNDGEVSGCTALCARRARGRPAAVMIGALLAACTSGEDPRAELEATDRALSTAALDGAGAEPHHPHPRGHRRPRPPRSSCGAELGFARIAQSSAELDIAAARPALNTAGVVAFAATNASGASLLSMSGRRGLTTLDMSVFGVGTAVQIGIDDARNVVFLAPSAGATTPFGLFTAEPSGQSLIFHYEAVDGGNRDDGVIDAEDAFALSPNGVLAFSSIAGSIEGAVYRTSSLGAPTLVVDASEVSRPFQFGFSEVRGLDINAGGTIAADMVHVTRCGLQDGVLVFDAPEPAFATVPHALTGVTSPLAVAIDDSGLVTFALGAALPEVAMTRCPPAGNFDFSFIVPGIYQTTPTPLPEAPVLTTVVDNTGPFAVFGAIETSPSGRLVFEAELDDGRRGIFAGPDPEADAILLVGDELEGEVVSEVQLGELNDACELSLGTTSAAGRSIWRAAGVSPRTP